MEFLINGLHVPFGSWFLQTSRERRVLQPLPLCESELHGTSSCDHEIEAHGFKTIQGLLKKRKNKGLRTKVKALRLRHVKEGSPKQ